MEKNILDRFRDKLKAHRDAIYEWFNNESDEKKLLCCAADSTNLPVEGNLRVISNLDNALNRIEKGTFGQCNHCGDDIKTERLDLDYTLEVCLDCYSQEQLRALEHDLELAAKVHRQLLPYTIPVLNGVQIAAHSAPAGIVGGDYFDFFHSKDGNQGVVIADVMGKGLPASMLMSNLQASLRILGPEIEEMDKLAYRVNELFRYNTNLISFISLFLAKIDSKNSTLEYCNAGHNPPIWWQSETKSIHQLKPSGPAIGLMHDVNYKSEKIKFNSGDLILIYTDGLVESRNEGNDEFGVQRITDIIDKNYSKSSEEFLSALLDSVKIFNGGNISDDITLLVLKIE